MDEEDPLQVLVLENPCTFDEYVSIDDDLQCAPLPNSEDIVASFRQAPEESDDAGDPLPIVSFKQAHSGFLALQSFLLHSCGTEPPYSLLGELKSELLKAGNNARIQTSITDYFEH